jgi:hypothetical protein
VADGEPEAGGGAAHFLTRVRLGCNGDGSGAAQKKRKIHFFVGPIKTSPNNHSFSGIAFFR